MHEREKVDIEIRRFAADIPISVGIPVDGKITEETFPDTFWTEGTRVEVIIVLMERSPTDDNNVATIAIPAHLLGRNPTLEQVWKAAEEGEFESINREGFIP